MGESYSGSIVGLHKQQCMNRIYAEMPDCASHQSLAASSKSAQTPEMCYNKVMLNSHTAHGF